MVTSARSENHEMKGFRVVLKWILKVTNPKWSRIILRSFWAHLSIIFTIKMPPPRPQTPNPDFVPYFPDFPAFSRIPPLQQCGQYAPWVRTPPNTPRVHIQSAHSECAPRVRTSSKNQKNVRKARQKRAFEISRLITIRFSVNLWFKLVNW